MINKNKCWQEFCQKNKDAIFIFQDSELIFYNTSADNLMKDTSISPDYLLKVLELHLDQNKHSLDDCLNCSIKQNMQDLSFPISLGNKKHKLNFMLSFQNLASESEILAITLTNLAQVQRIENIAQHNQLNRYIDRANEKERQRISQDLHDSVAQGIYSAIMGVRRISQEDFDAKKLAGLCKMIELQLNETLN